MKCYENVLGLIGNTPLVKLQRLVEPGMADVYAKIEFLNRETRSRTGWR